MSNPRSGWRRGRRGLDRRIAQAVQMAYEHGTPIPEEFARLAAAAGLREGMTVYGIGLGNRGAYAEAERWLQRACEQEDPVAMIALGTMHMDLGDLDKAEEYFSAARAYGHAGGARGLRLIADKRAAAGIPPIAGPAPAPPPIASPAAPAPPLPTAASADAAVPQRPPAPWQAPGFPAPGEEWSPGWAEQQLLLHVEDDPHPHVLLAMAVLQTREQHLKQAADYFTAAALTGDPFALYSWAVLRARGQGVAGAVEDFRRAADAGYPPAAHDLAHHLASQGQSGEAERYYKMAIDADYTDSLVNLGVLLRERGDLDGAEKCYRAAIAAGDNDAMNNLGNLLRQRGDQAGAEECYRIAADAGNTDALVSYGAILTERGDWSAAEPLLRQAAEAGHPAGKLNLIQVLVRSGRLQEAEQWLPAAGSLPLTAPPPTSPAASAGRPSDADAIAQWLTGPAALGDPDAQAALELLRDPDDDSAR